MLATHVDDMLWATKPGYHDRDDDDDLGQLSFWFIPAMMQRIMGLTSGKKSTALGVRSLAKPASVV